MNKNEDLITTASLDWSDERPHKEILREALLLVEAQRNALQIDKLWRVKAEEIISEFLLHSPHHDHLDKRARILIGEE